MVRISDAVVSLILEVISSVGLNPFPNHYRQRPNTNSAYNPFRHFYHRGGIQNASLYRKKILLSSPPSQKKKTKKLSRCHRNSLWRWKTEKKQNMPQKFKQISPVIPSRQFSSFFLVYFNRIISFIPV